MPSISRRKRIRTLALSAGLLMGMLGSTLAPKLAHAAKSKHAQQPSQEQLEDLTPPPEASPQQLLAAGRVLVGHYDCEFGKTVMVTPDTKRNGYFDLKLGQQSWTMKPVLSNTGAVRLEDVKGNALMIQILTKSMLLDPKAGHRIVDDCVQDSQRAAQEQLRLHPVASVFNLNGDDPDAPSK